MRFWIVLYYIVYSSNERTSIAEWNGDGMYVRERIADPTDADCGSPAAVTTVSGV